MNKPTARKIIEINKQFYAAISDSFDKTRQKPWTGWYELLPIINNYQPLVLVDYGCGNGRFFQFLSDKGLEIERAIGFDSDSELLNKAQGRNIDNIFFKQTDIFNMLPKMCEPTRVITAFGVLHHLPGIDSRREWVRSLLKQVVKPGLVIISLWRIPGAVPVTNVYPELTAEFEPGDVWLGWKGNFERVRYCHAFQEEEIADLMDLSARTVIRFDADGTEEKSNTYIIYRL